MMMRALALALWMMGTASAAEPVADDPLTRPMAVDRAKEWLAPLPPEKIFGTSYLVGFGGLSVALIDTGDGLVLIDGALPQAAPMILANVRSLGFDPAGIKLILSTEPHWDHAGGFVALARDTGATVIASARGVEGLRAGALAKDDPQLAYGGHWPAVTTRVRVVKDGDVLKLGDAEITAHATPGHTMGSMSWSWRACEGGACKAIVFASSLNPVSADDYRYTAAGKPFVAGFAKSYKLMDALTCDVLISAHPDNAGEGRFNARPGACRAYAERSRGLLAKRLAAEKAGTAK